MIGILCWQKDESHEATEHIKLEEKKIELKTMEDGEICGKE